MRILLPLGAFYPSQIGGPCNTLYWHTCALKSKGFYPTILTTSSGIKKEIIETNKWIEKPCGEVYYSEKDLPSFSKSFYELAKALADNEVIHLNSLFNYYSIFSFLYCKFFLRKKKIIWSVRGELNENALKFSSSKKKIFLFLYKILNRNIYFHSTSNQETVDIKKHFKSNEVLQFPNYIEPNQRLNINKKKQLLFLGRIHEIKAIHKLIDAFDISKKFRDSEYQFVIAGKHESRHEEYFNFLKQKIKDYSLEDKIKFLGHIEGQEKEMLYAESEILILPSETENFGNVVLEALNQSTPVIASKGTPWEILEEYNCGFHVSNDPLSLGQSIDDYLSLDILKKEKLRNNCTKLVDKEFNINNNILNWIKVYKSIANANHKK